MDPFGVACPACAQQPKEECNWSIAEHPRFHAERIEAAVMLFGIQQGLKDQPVDQKVEDVAMGAVVDAML